TPDRWASTSCTDHRGHVATDAFPAASSTSRSRSVIRWRPSAYTVAISPITAEYCPHAGASHHRGRDQRVHHQGPPPARPDVAHQLAVCDAHRFGPTFAVYEPGLLRTIVA